MHERKIIIKMNNTIVEPINDQYEYIALNVWTKAIRAK